MDTARNSPEFERAAADCGYKRYDGSEPWTFARKPIAQDPDFEEVGWPRARQWWSRPPILSTDDAVRRERLFAWSNLGGTKGSDKGKAMLAVYFEMPSASTDDHDLHGVVTGGGFVIEHYTPKAVGTIPPLADPKPVRVRGANGQVGDVAGLRLMVWPGPDGAKLALWTSRSAFTDVSAVGLADGLDDRR
jgi:hypothetical protein